MTSKRTIHWEEGWKTWKYSCKVCNATYSDLENMCPKRKDVCIYCCLRCDLDGSCEYTGDPDSLDNTADCYKRWQLANRDSRR